MRRDETAGQSVQELLCRLWVHNSDCSCTTAIGNPTAGLTLNLSDLIVDLVKPLPKPLPLHIQRNTHCSSRAGSRELS